MTSAENVLQGFEWDYDGTVGFSRGPGYMGSGISRTIFLHPKIEDIPEQLFAVKVSQSSNPQKAGKFVFKYLSYKVSEDQPSSDMAPSSVDMTTPLAQIKEMFIWKVGALPGASVFLNIGLKGAFTNIQCADGLFALYDEGKEEFKTDDPNTTGNAPYYIKSDAQIHVKLKGAMSKQGNAYIQTTLSSTSTSDEIFVKPQRGAIWNPDDQAAAPAPAAPAGETPASIW